MGYFIVSILGYLLETPYELFKKLEVNMYYFTSEN